MDGHFVPNLTFGPAMCAALRPHIRGTMDVHLMIAPADPYIGAFADAGADILTVHPEGNPHIHRTLQSIRAKGKKAGLAINPGTPAQVAAEVIDLLDVICVMTVNPGFGGQTFLASQLPKIRALREIAGARPVLIEIDGGINLRTAPEAAAAGADVLVAGAAVFGGGAETYAANISGLRKAAQGVMV
jgi:ribulose-phosphate 3-epimerase